LAEILIYDINALVEISIYDINLLKNKLGKQMKLVVIIPAFNEEKTIANVINSIPKRIAGIKKIEVLVVDDGSTDKTADLARRSGAKVLKHLTNRGLGKSFSDAINAALVLGADIIVNLDADGQFKPDEIPKIIKPIQKNQAEVVIGTRFKNKKTYKMPLMKRIGNLFFARLITALTRQKFSDVTCGFRAYAREAALHINISDPFSYTLETLIDLKSKGFKILEIPINATKRKWGKSKIAKSLIFYGLKSILIVARQIRDKKTIQFFGGLGIIFLVMGAASFIFILVRYIMFSMVSPYRAVLSLGIFFIALAVLFFSFGLITDLFTQIRKNQEEIIYRLKKK
jgi:glycosyltransferase involved in cell wall biosynthesis